MPVEVHVQANKTKQLDDGRVRVAATICTDDACSMADLVFAERDVAAFGVDGHEQLAARIIGHLLAPRDDGGEGIEIDDLDDELVLSALVDKHPRLAALRTAAAAAAAESK